jgi:hypothetical protein
LIRFHISQLFKNLHPGFPPLFNRLLSKILKLFYSYGENVSVAAIDATGFYEFIYKLLFQKNREASKKLL